MSLALLAARALENHRSAPGWTLANLASPPSAWFNDTSSLTVATGASVWGDLSGNGFNLTQVNASDQPSVNASGLNGRRTLSFDGINYFMVLSGGALAIFNGVSSAWLMMVARKGNSDSSPTSRRTWGFQGGSAGVRIQLYEDDATSGNTNRIVLGARRLDTEAYNFVASTGTWANTWASVLACVDYSARTMKLYIGGALDNSKSGAFTAGGNTSATNSVVAGLSNTSFWKGDMAECACGVGLPSSAEITQIFAYTAGKWGV